MNSERNIINRLYESKSLDESSFEANGSTYSCSFGRYYKDGEPISRDDYFKVKDGGVSNKSSVKPSVKKSKDKVSGPELKPVKSIDFSGMSNEEIFNSDEAVDMCYDLEDNISSITKHITGDGADDRSSEIVKNNVGDVTFKSQGLIYPDATFDSDKGRLKFGGKAGKQAGKFSKSVEDYFRKNTDFNDNVDVDVYETEEGYRYVIKATKYSD